MRQYHLAAAMLLAGVLAGCGGGGSGSQAPKVKFTSQVSFGDSLSDVGSYGVGSIAAAGGGQFTINGTGKNWTELMAAQEGQTAPCAAVTGGYGTATATHTGCYGYAQGGARVSSAGGIGNTGTVSGVYTGAITDSVTTQISNHLTAVGGSFSGTEVVHVLAGANDVFIQAGTYPVLLAAPYNLTPAQALATVTAAISAEADNLATLVTGQLIANGAKYVVVVNIPDIANTPYAIAAEASSAGTRALLDTLVTTFNTELQTKLANNANVLLVDAYTVNRDEVTNPAAYGLTNVTATACDVTGTYLATYFGGSSLGCTASTLVSGVSADTHYLFADSVHPTPYGYLQLARLVSKEMLIKGWL